MSAVPSPLVPPPAVSGGDNLDRPSLGAHKLPPVSMLSALYPCQAGILGCWQLTPLPLSLHLRSFSPGGRFEAFCEGQ